jgi:hypothetical protein
MREACEAALLRIDPVVEYLKERGVIRSGSKRTKRRTNRPAGPGEAGPARGCGAGPARGGGSNRVSGVPITNNSPGQTTVHVVGRSPQPTKAYSIGEIADRARGRSNPVRASVAPIHASRASWFLMGKAQRDKGARAAWRVAVHREAERVEHPEPRG